MGGVISGMKTGEGDFLLTLRKKTAFILLGIFLVLLAVLCLSSWLFIMGSFGRLERDDAVDEVLRARNVFDDDLQNIDTVLRDWAVWDDAYAFMANPNQYFISSNLTPGVFENLRLDVIAFLDTRGELVFGKRYDAASRGLLPPYPDLLPALEPVLGAPQDTGDGKTVSGVLSISEGPLLLAAEPILTSAGEGPPRGTLVMGRLLDEEEVLRLAEISHQDLDIVPVAEEGLPPDLERARARLLEGEDTVVLSPAAGRIAGYMLIEDLGGEPALVIKAELPRNIHRQGINTLLWYALFLLASFLLFGAAMFLVMERMVLSRLALLNSEVAAIGSSADAGARVGAEGRDEISHLASSINAMLDRLERSEERFQSLIENALDIVVIIDREGTVTYESPAVQRVLGYERGYFLARSAFELVHPDDLEEVMQTFTRLLLTPAGIERVAFRYRDRAGKWRHFEVLAYNMLEDPEVEGIVINARDISDQARARERVSRLNRLFIGQVADSNRNMKNVVLVARELLEVDLAGYMRAGRGGYLLFTSEDASATPRPVEGAERYLAFDIIAKGLREPVVIRDIASEGFVDTSPLAVRHRPRFFAGHPVTAGGRSIGCLFLMDKAREALDEDDLALLGTLAHVLSVEEERLAYEQGIKDFLDVASHELRHPITLMKGYTLTLRDYGDRLDERQRREFLDIVNQGADRMDALIKELLDVSRIERGRMELKKRLVAPAEVVAAAVGEMREKWPAYRFELRVEGTPAPRDLDPEKIDRVMVILMDNACEHSPPGSIIDVTVEERDEGLLVSVMDHGVGIPESERELIFERFHQVEDTLRRSSQGMGLGLYIAREIVQGHGGRIWHEHREGGGSIFRFTIP